MLLSVAASLYCSAKYVREVKVRLQRQNFGILRYGRL